MKVQRSDPIAEYNGGTTRKITKIIKNAEGCVLFVDETYTLCSPSKPNFGKETVETLMVNMNNNANRNIKNNIMIFVGYKEQMNDLMNK